jgi:hypothetical protein
VGRLSRLNRLLLSLYDGDELRRFLVLGLGAEGMAIEQALPGSGASTAVLVYETVQALERRGLINDEFFATVIADRPRREKMVRRVQRDLECKA